jgi:uncharacterized NAD-dependent epimerase/dehydratase family protein
VTREDELLADAEAVVIWLRKHDGYERDDMVAAFAAATIERMALLLSENQSA